MARATTRTLLPIDRWGELLGINPLHLNQVTSAFMPYTTCSALYKQHDWQESAAIGRESIAQAIDEAERRLAEHLGFTLLPTWQEDERLSTVKLADNKNLNISGLDVQGYRQSVQAAWAKYISGGVEAKTLIDDAAAVVYSDSDSDGYKETATVTVNTTVTETSEIAVYFPGQSGADEWEVRPLRNVVISGGVATITMYRHQLVKPELWEAFDPTAVDGDVDGNFLTTVDVYRHWNNPEQQVQLLWSNEGGCGCDSDDCGECTISTQWGCLVAKNYDLSILSYRPGTWDSVTSSFDNASYGVARNPDRLRLWYYAGLQDERRKWPTLQMHPDWERAVAYYSLTFLQRDICGCQNLQALTGHWRQDLNLSIASAAGSSNWTLTESQRNNPLGTTRGAIAAWERIRSNRKGHAVKL